MVSREVELKGLDGLSLLFTWAGKKKLFALVEAKTENQFALKMGELDKTGDLNDELFEKMYFIGLNWKEGAPITKEDSVPSLLEKFCQINGFGSTEIRDTLIDALCNSGILIKSLVLAGRRARDGELDFSKITESKPAGRGIDTGEAGEILT